MFLSMKLPLTNALLRERLYSNIRQHGLTIVTGSKAVGLDGPEHSLLHKSMELLHKADLNTSI